MIWWVLILCAILVVAWLWRPRQTPEYYVSLSTIPGRDEALRKTLNSLIRQHIPPRAIFLNLPYFSKRFQKPYQVPTYLDQAPYRDTVRLNRCHDYGPATKLIPALEILDNDSRILVVDDDQQYPPEMSSFFLSWETKMPQAALCMRGGRFVQFAPLRREMKQADKTKTPESVDYMAGWKGYLVKPRFFDLSALKDYSQAPEGAFFVDDVWISGHLARQKVPRFVIPAPRLGRASRDTDDTTSLARAENHRSDKGDTNNQTTAIYFLNDW